MLRKGGKVRRFLMMGLVAVPWFFRDHFAASLDEQAREAQQVLTEKSDHEHSQQQNTDQRAIMNLLSRVALKDLSEKDKDKAEVDEFNEEAHREGKALADDVKAFRSLFPSVSIDQKQMEATADNAAAVAERLQGFTYDPKALTTAEEFKEKDDEVAKLQDDMADSDEKLRQAWSDLEAAAQKDRQESSNSAGVARAIAWICTAIGALMIGDWKKFLAGFTGGDGESNAEEQTG